MPDIMDCSGGINLRLPAWDEALAKRKQCVYLQNLRWRDGFAETVQGTRKFQSTSLGSGKVSAILPYYNDQNDQFELLCAFEDSIYKKDFPTNEWVVLKSALTPNSVFGACIRQGVMYIPSVSDGLTKYQGGSQIESVGAGLTAPGSFRVAIYMKEVDRIFGISDNAILGQITWCDFGDPESWDAANVERMKLTDGERTEGADVLYGKLIIFNTYSIWIYYVAGNEENWNLEQAPTTVGCVAPNTIKKVGSEIWFLGQGIGEKLPLGVYAFNGSTARLLSDDISPFLRRANKNKLRNACAEVQGNLYTLSFALDASETNNVSVDLDILNPKEDGSPAIYGPHTFAFYSSAVLNGRKGNNEFLMGDEADGFVYWASGTTLKSIDGSDGQLMQQRFLSMVHSDDTWDLIKRYPELRVFFRPRAFFSATLNYYISYSQYGVSSTWTPSAESVSFAGHFDIYSNRIKGVPDLYTHVHRPGPDAFGTSIQLELINDRLAQRMEIQGYGYDSEELHRARKVERYAF